jgi:DNA-binding helix-hairpin-helix protein with protein kinase domain
MQYVAHFNWDRRLEMLHDVAAGMSYLHGKDHVHGDLRSPNLFVGADGKVRLLVQPLVTAIVKRCDCNSCI